MDMGNEKDVDSWGGSVVSTPYDDVFRTLLNDCRSLIIPVLNEVFGEAYTGEERIEFAPNEHFLNRQDGDETKRVTDTSFTVIGRERKRYLLECQSTADSSMLVRIFEYATQIGLDQGSLSGTTLRVTIPHSAVLFLRSNSSTPDKMGILIETPGGTVAFDVLVMEIRRYTLEELFAKRLLFLIPCYIFTHEARFEEYDEDMESLETLKAEYISLMEKLDGLLRAGEISVYIHKTIVEMSGKVLENISQKYENVRKGVRSVMGGKILEYEAKTILNQGIAQGMAQGITQGIDQGRLQQAWQTARRMLAVGRYDQKEIAELNGLSLADVKKLAQEMRADEP